MELEFDPNLEYQLDAINSVVDLFEGQQKKSGMFETDVMLPATRMQHSQEAFSVYADASLRNNLGISQDKLLSNLQEVQQGNDIDGRSDELDGMHFSVEMETGTGKTYVYLRTIHELYQEYDFKKFIIVVPSIAIREGVKKNLEITEGHFKKLYGNVNPDYFVYDSDELEKLRSFATADHLQIMVINIDAFRRDENIIHRVNEGMGGRKPIDFVQSTNPIVIMDEPQNMETKKSKKAIQSLNPMCTLRYSATHRKYYNLLYDLTPVDAYDLGLVKKIEVDSVQEENSVNDAYIAVESITAQRTQVKTKLEIEKNTREGTKKEKITIRLPDDEGVDLYEESNERSAYDGYVITGIDAENGYVEFANGEQIYEGRVEGELTEQIQKVQMKETIKEHLDKTKKLRENGIKVLSLFFIDKVNNYRDYDQEDTRGKFAHWFEKMYAEILEEEYPELDMPEAEAVHEGYFSKDRQGRVRDSKTGDAQYDAPTYELIMQDKERLLSFDEPVQFIFSHSALREGWDNPNVFQICTLNETKSQMKKRQEIGRGLRIPVDQEGERVFDHSLNILTVVANESYEDFAQALQSEMEEGGYEFGTDRVKDRGDRKRLELKKGWEADQKFLDIWERIKPKTKYEVQLDSDELVQRVVDRLEGKRKVRPPKIKVQKSKLKVNKKGIDTKVTSVGNEEADVEDIAVPNLLDHLSRDTDLTKQTLLSILEESGGLSEALINPQQLIDMCVEAINSELQKMMVDGIKYEQVGDSYAMSLFESEELEAYAENMYEVKNQQKTLFDHVIYDSDHEEGFVEELEALEQVKFYIKLPNWFTIDTPLGSYNPDWAVVFNGDKRLYFVAETKASTDEKDLRLRGKLKAECGREHFKQLEGVEFRLATEPQDLPEE
jgi:type III restriction enzyme